MSIPIPAGMEQAPVTWTLGHTTGTEALRGARGLVRFEPTAVAVAYPDVTVLPATVTARVTTGVMDPVDLTVNDPDLWNWRVVPELGVAWTPFHIDVPVEGVDLATAVVVPGIGPIRAVTGPPGTTAWDELTGKPATYPPDTHTHEITDVDGLQGALDGKVSSTTSVYDINNANLLNGWTSAVTTQLIRQGAIVMLVVPSGGLDGSDATADRFLKPPNGYRPTIPGNYANIGYISTGAGSALLRKDVDHLASSDRVRFSGGVLMWPTADAEPS